MTYEKFKNWLYTSKYKTLIRTNANQDQMMLDAWNACLELQAQTQPTQEQEPQHPDDSAVDKFAEAMKQKLAKKREQGRSGWSDKEICREEWLQKMLLGHVVKGDPVDVGNFAMMLFNRGEKTQFPIEAQPTQEPVKKYCKKCASFRSGDICHKCNGETFVPHGSFTEPPLPPIDLIRSLAKEVGYGIGLHGTQKRDLDVIAAPWTENAVGNSELIQHIAKGLNAVILDEERKPLGRYAATIQIDGWYKPLDLSVCPRSQAQEPENKPVGFITQESANWLKSDGDLMDAKMSLTFRTESSSGRYTIPFYLKPPQIQEPSFKEVGWLSWVGGLDEMSELAGFTSYEPVAYESRVKVFIQSQIQEPESKWISVEEAKATFKNDGFLRIRSVVPESDLDVAKEALRKLACLGNGDAYGNSTGNQIAIDALKALEVPPAPEGEKT